MTGGTDLLRSGLALVVALSSVAACDGDQPVPLVSGVTKVVSAVDNTFRPVTLEVAAGTVVSWTNGGRHAHNVVPVDGDGWGVAAEAFAPEDEHRHRFTEPGTYRYYCTLHGTTTKGMVGTIVVTG